MSELKAVALTNVNCENFSRQELLEFINSKIQGNYLKVEQLSSGAAYCQILEMLFPNSVGQRRIKLGAKMEHEFLHNWRLLQQAFIKLKYDKSVPMDRLVKGRFQDNFEFLQWFKKFYDSVHGKENISQTLSVTMKPSKMLPRKTSPKPRIEQTESLVALKESVAELGAQIENVKNERDYYLNKATAVEALVKASLECEEHTDLCKRIEKILYATEIDGRASSELNGSQI